MSSQLLGQLQLVIIQQRRVGHHYQRHLETQRVQYTAGPLRGAQLLSGYVPWKIT